MRSAMGHHLVTSSGSRTDPVPSPVDEAQASTTGDVDAAPIVRVAARRAPDTVDPARAEREVSGVTDARLWHRWLRIINRVLRVMLRSAMGRGGMGLGGAVLVRVVAFS
jgi:hypothetical protein